MLHPRTHLNLIFCVGAVMTLHSASAQNSSSKIRYTNGLHGGIDIARSSMALTDKHPLATDLSNPGYPMSGRFRLLSSNTRFRLPIWQNGFAPFVPLNEYVNMFIDSINLLNDSKSLLKLAKDEPYLKQLSRQEKAELALIKDNLKGYELKTDEDGKKIKELELRGNFTLFVASERYKNLEREPKNVNCLGLQTRVYGDESVHSLDYLYGNRHPSVDVGLQSFWGSSSGVGIGLRFPLFRLRGFFNDVDPNIEYVLTGNVNDIKDEDSYSLAERNFIKTIERNVKKEQARYVTDIQHPAIAFVGGARTIDRVGQTYNAGVNFSILKELSKHGPSVELLASTQYFWFHSRLKDAQGGRVPSSETARFGLGFAVNDRMVEFEELIKGDKEDENYTEGKRYNLKYWHWQAGAEYSFKNRLTEGDTVTGYLRNRDNGGNEYTVYAGVASAQGFFGFAFSKKFK